MLRAPPNSATAYINKKVLLCECKRHTTHRVASASSAALSSDGRGYPHPVLTAGGLLGLDGGAPFQSGWGVPPSNPDGVLPSNLGGVPPSSLDRGGGTPIQFQLGGTQGIPSAGWGLWPEVGPETNLQTKPKEQIRPLLSDIKERNITFSKMVRTFCNQVDIL